MRRIATICVLLALTGCSSTRWGFVKNNDRPSGPVPTEVPAATQLVEYLNNNAERIKALRIDDLDLTLHKGIQGTNVRGTMVTQKPHNFRLGANLLGNPVVDLGSNEQEFWYWISKADPPYQVYCGQYKDLHEGRVRKMPFPFQPEWVMESLGLGPYGPADKYKVEHDAETIRLVEKTTSPEGNAVRKVIVFKRRRVQAPTPQVTDYLLLDDASGKEMCAAHITEVQVDTGTGAVVPKRLELRWPKENLKIAMHMGATTINPLVSPETFTRRTNPNIQSFNLARMQIDNSPPPQAFSGLDSKVRPVQGLNP